MSRRDEHPLRLERKRRNLSQRMLADFSGLGLSTIVRAERGEPIGADTRRRLCDYLGKSSEELGLFRLEGAAGATLSGAPPRLTGDGPDGSDMSRRQVLKHLAVAGIGASIGSTAGVHGLLSGEPWERLSRILRSSFAVDEATLAHLRAITTSYWHLRATGTSRELLGGILGHLHTITDLLDASGSLASRRELIAIAGEAALAGGRSPSIWESRRLHAAITASQCRPPRKRPFLSYTRSPWHGPVSSTPSAATQKARSP